MNCHYHPIYRSCSNCGQDMERGEKRECDTVARSVFPPAPVERLDARTQALREARAVIHKHAVSTYKAGLIERSDGITEVLVDFDLAFPEVLS